MRTPSAFLALLLLACAAQALAGTLETFPARLVSPSMITALGDTVTVLDTVSGAILQGNPRNAMEPQAVGGRPRALGADEKGQTIIVTGDPATGLKANIYSGARKLRSLELKAAGPLSSISDVASRNEIIWLLQGSPPLVALFGGDGAEIARADLTGIAVAPYSLALGNSGEAYITDPLGASIIELNAFGRFSGSHRLTGTGFTRPAGIALGPGGSLFISDTILGEVALFSEKNRVLGRDWSFAPIPVDDPIRLCVALDKLWIIQGWSAKISRIPIR